METMPVATRNHVRLENCERHILIVNQIGKGKVMRTSQKHAPKRVDFASTTKYSTRIFPKREHF